MTEVTRIDCHGVCGYGQEDAVLAAYQAGDIMELGMIAKRQIEKCAADRIKYHEALKDSVRAEILAEVCA